MCCVKIDTLSALPHRSVLASRPSREFELRIFFVQWIGPLVSDLIGSHAILQVELNSTTDNPLIDVTGGIIHHGGNFQVSLSFLDAFSL